MLNRIIFLMCLFCLGMLLFACARSPAQDLTPEAVVTLSITPQVETTLLPTSTGAPVEIVLPVLDVGAAATEPASIAQPAAMSARNADQPTMALAAADAEPIPAPGLWYALQEGTPLSFPNFSRPDAGCNWMGVGGQVFDLDEQPVPGLVVNVQGVLNGQLVEYLTLTGDAPAIGPGGYEITLASLPIASDDSLTIVVTDLDGRQVSPAVLFDTSADCLQAFTLINFRQTLVVPKDGLIYLPVILREFYISP